MEEKFHIISDPKEQIALPQKRERRKQEQFVIIIYTRKHAIASDKIRAFLHKKKSINFHALHN